MLAPCVCDLAPHLVLQMFHLFRQQAWQSQTFFGPMIQLSNFHFSLWCMWQVASTLTLMSFHMTWVARSFQFWPIKIPNSVFIMSTQTFPDKHCAHFSTFIYSISSDIHFWTFLLRGMLRLLWLLWLLSNWDAANVFGHCLFVCFELWQINICFNNCDHVWIYIHFVQLHFIVSTCKHAFCSLGCDDAIAATVISSCQKSMGNWFVRTCCDCSQAVALGNTWKLSFPCCSHSAFSYTTSWKTLHPLTQCGSFVHLLTSFVIAWLIGVAPLCKHGNHFCIKELLKQMAALIKMSSFPSAHQLQFWILRTTVLTLF